MRAIQLLAQVSGVDATALQPKAAQEQLPHEQLCRDFGSPWAIASRQ